MRYEYNMLELEHKSRKLGLEEGREEGREEGVLIGKISTLYEIYSDSGIALGEVKKKILEKIDISEEKLDTIIASFS